MKSVTSYGLLVECFWFALFCGSATHLLADSVYHKWEKLYLVHHWPVTVCMMNENECNNPPMYWTIHGLWPDKAAECNRSWHFNISELKDFMEDMREYWPDILHTNHTHFCFLSKVGIKPGSTYYQLTAIKEALESFYNIMPKIQCIPPEEGRLQVIGQIKFCFTKEFTLRNCTEEQSGLSSALEDDFFRTEDLSVCNDTLTYYPSHMKTHKHFAANVVVI
ncbi:ribonuclease T2 isoform X2 [Pituophis catenifer annectens]|uniref:ribonuclease T2 isoform X2 n=1 Tax=Pituophis catenifer annectens TaxID=94852 RepID=UPI003994259C